MTTSEQAAARIDAPPDPDKLHRVFLALVSEYIEDVAGPGEVCKYVARVYGDEALADMVLALQAKNERTS